MSVMVALLRGINVGGSGILPMARLREIATSVGFTEVRTYIQSGNVVFAGRQRSTDAAAVALRSAIVSSTGLDPQVIVRTRDELAAVVDANPFLQRGDDPDHLHVMFLDEDAEALIEGLDLRSRLPEEAIAIGRELYLQLPAGMGRSKLATDLARRLGSTGTVRNWRTVTTLLGMARELA